MGAEDFYTGIVTDVYAALRSTTFDAACYLEFVRDAGEPALELGCGDDGPFLELVRRGIDVEAVDSSQDMLDRCHARADTEGLRIVTYCQPMQDLALPRTYRAIYLAGPTFTLLPDDDTARRALRGIAAHLEPGGQAMIPLWIPAATDRREFGRTREALTPDGATARYTVESEDYDVIRRTRCTRTRYELDRGAGTGTGTGTSTDPATGRRTESLRRDWIIHWHTPEGFTALAREAGLVLTHLTPVQDGEFTAVLRRPSETAAG